MTPTVSIVILNYFHPEIIDVCLRSLQITDYDSFEVIVVDNGSDEATIAELEKHKAEGRIDTLVLAGVNHMFSEGNNIGFRNSDPGSKYILLLNSDVGVIRPDWLTKQVAWMEGTIETKPSIWGLRPTVVEPGPRDIISFGFAWDTNVLPSMMRPEGFCCLIRRSVWVDLSPDIPWHGGFEEAMAIAIRNGAKCGVLSQYPPYLVHREGGSAPGTWTCGPVEAPPTNYTNIRQPDIATWFAGLNIETLDFTLGPNEHLSYLLW